MSNFHPLEVVGRGSETQLQLGEDLNSITWREKGSGRDYYGFSCHTCILPWKAKRQYLLTFHVSRHGLLALQSSSFLHVPCVVHGDVIHESISHLCENIYPYSFNSRTWNKLAGAYVRLFKNFISRFWDLNECLNIKICKCLITN